MRWLDEMTKIATSQNEEKDTESIAVTAELIDAIANRVIEKLSENVEESTKEKEEDEEEKEENENE